MSLHNLQTNSDIRQALAKLLPADAYLSPEEARARYGASTIRVSRSLAGAVRVSNQTEVVQVLQLMRQHRVPIFPISTGNNWGYGSANPVVDDCMILDLSAMDKIRSVDPLSGVAVIEPGVTQGSLTNYLTSHNLPFLCPVTGAGPTCSLIGNALERGYGITPHADHFLAVTSLEAVLPDGTIYQSPLAASGCEEVGRLFKWGIGPYLDGLFTQSGLGIVTQMTIRLAPRPKVVNGFFFAVGKDEQLEEVVSSVSEVLSEVGGALGSINVMNQRRVVSMMEPYPSDKVAANSVIDEDTLHELAKRNQVGSWMGAGAIYGNRPLASAARKTVRQKLSGKVERLMFFSPTSVTRYHSLSKLIPGRIGQSTQSLLATLSKTLDILTGAPSDVALPLAYWKSGKMPTNGEPLNPARNGCGLIWYAPLVPMRAESVRQFTTMVHRVCIKHAVEPLITLTSLSEVCFDSTVPILFNPQEEGAAEAAHACFSELLTEGRKLGFTPYRSPISAMDRVVDLDQRCWQLAQQIKDSIDPDRLLAPGRYSAVR
ncbi:MAG: FAD-binding oxidoreductase [Pseudomonadota bacterium]